MTWTGSCYAGWWTGSTPEFKEAQWMGLHLYGTHSLEVFNIFINGLHASVECIPSKFTDDTKLGCAVDSLEGWGTWIDWNIGQSETAWNSTRVHAGCFTWDGVMQTQVQVLDSPSAKVFKTKLESLGNLILWVTSLPVYGGVGTWWSLRFLSTQAILWVHSMNKICVSMIELSLSFHQIMFLITFASICPSFPVPTIVIWMTLLTFRRYFQTGVSLLTSITE